MVCFQGVVRFPPGLPTPPWVGSRSPDGWDQIPRWAGGWACTSHPGVLGSIPKREEPGKTGRHPVLKYRVPHGSQVTTLAALPRLHNSPLAKCGCKKFCMDFHGDHTSTCTAHSGATKAHDWMVSVLGPLFRTAGHTVRTQHGVTASAGQRRGDVEIRNYLQSPGREPEFGL